MDARRKEASERENLQMLGVAVDITESTGEEEGNLCTRKNKIIYTQQLFRSSEARRSQGTPAFIPSTFVFFFCCFSPVEWLLILQEG